MFKGSCCGGGVQFEVLDNPVMSGTCFCSRCRKVGASSFMLVKKESFKLIKGKELISTFHPGTTFKYHRNFCRVCGTGLGEVLSTDDSFPVSLNCVDDGPEIELKFTEHEEDIPKWYQKKI